MEHCAIIFRLTCLVALTVWPLHASAEPSPHEAKPRCSGTPTLCELVSKEAERVGLNPALIDAIIKVESDYRPEAVGAAGEIGLMQVLPSTARLLGFNGNDKELADPATNIRLGVAYFAGAWSLAGGDICRSLMKYRAGHAEERMTPLSLEYCCRAREYLAQSRQIADSELISSPSKARSVNSQIPPVDRRLKGAAFWAAQKARVQAITTLVHERWDRIAKGEPNLSQLWEASAWISGQTGKKNQGYLTIGKGAQLGVHFGSMRGEICVYHSEPF
jgi:hypothetical protein